MGGAMSVGSEENMRTERSEIFLTTTNTIVLAIFLSAAITICDVGIPSPMSRSSTRTI